MASINKISGLLVILLALLQTSFVAVHSADIFFFAALGSHSTRMSKWPLMEALAQKGHNVTYLTVFPGPEDPTSKVKILVPKKWKETMGDWEDQMDMYQERRDNTIFTSLSMWTSGFPDIGRQACDALYTDEEFVNWIKSSKFDLVVPEIFWNECAYGMAHFWKAKLAVYGTSTVPPWAHDAFGLPDETSTTHDMIYGFKSDHEMTLYERFVNAINPIVMTWHREHIHLPALEESTRKGLGVRIPEDFPSFKEIERNNTLVFLTTHYSMDYARSFPPHVVPVGGNVVIKNPKPLPKEMEDFVNSRKGGFIYISFGSGINLGSFPIAIQNVFIGALGQFPEIGFVLKTAKPLNVTDIPKNVLVTRWAPQQTLLAHPKIKAFITHGGMGSAAETIHYSVPVICLPLMGEQDYNCDMYVRKGAGVFVEIVGLKQQQLEHAIREILANKKYKTAMNKATSIFKDRPTPPLENAVWWVEYILRHDNVHEHLVPRNVQQAWWKRRQVDIWFIAAGLLLTAIAVPAYILLTIYRKVVGKGRNDSSKPKTKIKKN